MQFNCTSPFLQNLRFDPFSISKVPAPLYPQIIGEGDVISVTFPDGNIQLYFVPTNRHCTWSPFQLNANSPNLHCTPSTDIWFVRSISNPLPPSSLNRPFPNFYGDQLLSPQINSNFCINSTPCADYYQKFHNDNSTSTTDIHYFYPSLRCNGNMKYSAEVQTEPFAINNMNDVGGCHGRCSCKCSVTKKKINTNGEPSASSTSYMSIDSSSKSKHRLSKKNEKKSKTKSNKNRDHRCECHLDTKYASDKFVATYAEKASGSTVKGGKHTQTGNKKSKRSDIKTEIWVPIDCKSGSRLNIDACDSYSDKCSCRSSSETDGY